MILEYEPSKEPRDQCGRNGMQPLNTKVHHLPLEVDIRLPEKENSTSHGARPVSQNHLEDSVDSDQ